MCLHKANENKRSVKLTFQDIDKNSKEIWVAEKDYEAFIEAPDNEAFISKFFPYLSAEEIDFILNATDCTNENEIN